MGTYISKQDATIVELSGVINSQNNQGEMVPLKVGDTLRQNTSFNVAADATFKLEYSDGTIVTQADFQDTAEVTSAGFEATETIIEAIVPEIAALQAQILSGEDPTLNLPDTAAGETSPAGNEGGGFISVGRAGDETIAAAGHSTDGFIQPQTSRLDEQPNFLEQFAKPTITTSSVTLYEENLAEGSAPQVAALSQAESVSVAVQAGIQALTINGAQVFVDGNFIGPVTIPSEYGTLVITAYDPTNSILTYSYTLNSALDHSESDILSELFVVQLTDNQGDSTTAVVTANIVDDAPTGLDDVNAITEDNLEGVFGNVLANDTLGADLAQVTQISSGSGTAEIGAESTIAGVYGSLVIAADGSYNYILNNQTEEVQSLALGEQITDTFDYLLVDADGDEVSLTLVITITGENDAPVITSSFEDAQGNVVEAGVLVGGNEATAGITETGGVLAATDIDDGAVLTWSLNDAAETPYGIFSLDESTGSWTFILSNELADSLAVGDQVSETFNITVTDEYGLSANQVVTVTINGTNDIPLITSTIQDATGDVLEAGVMDGGNDPEPGNLMTSGTLTADDVDNGASWSWSFVAQVNDYGTFDIDADSGVWSYTLADNALVNALAQGEMHDETFLVTVTDEHGAYSQQLVTVTVTGTNDIPLITSTIQDATGDVLEAGVMDGGNDPEPGNLMTGGTLTADDVDNGASWSWSFVAQVNDYGTFGIDTDTGVWSYTLADNALVNALAQGEMHDETFLVTVTDEHGAYSQQLVTVTVTGTNDIPLITSSIDDATGDVLEAGVMDGGNDPEPGNLMTGGTLTADDVDNGASWSWSFVAQVNDYGTFDIDADTGVWSYTLADNALVNALAQGEMHDETFLVTVTDEHGAYSQQLVTVTVTGTNDIPLITSSIDDATGDVLEAGVMDGGNDPEPGNLMTSGTLTADDVDNGASWSWSFVAQVNDYGTFDIDADSGVWSYTLADNALVNALAQDEMHDETFLVTVTDEHGAYSQQLVTVTVTGTNDIPLITSTIQDATGDVLEAGVMDGGNDPEPGNLMTGGTLTADDVDNGASWSWSFVAQVNDYGTFDIDTDTGVWSYTLADNALVNALAQGEMHDETFLVTVTDEHGAYSQQLVTVTVTGTNDIPLITSTIQDATGDVLEAGVMDGGNDPEPGNLMTGGTLTADDVDNGASWSWSFVAQVNDYGTFDIDTDTGVWSYTLADNALVNALAQGEMHDETFLVTVTDEHGAYSQQLVTVTVTGTNDIPLITSTIDDATGDVLEAGVMDGGNDPEPGNLMTGGTLTADDVDNGASWSWSFVAQVNDYGTFDIDPDTGVWSYTLADNALVNALAQGEMHDETFLVTVTDEHGAYSQQLVTVTVTGTNDIPLITSSIDDATGDVLEAGVMDGGNDPEPGSLMTGGTLTADDVDNGASWSWSFVAQVNDYGTFDIDADSGVWSYTLADNALVNALAQGEMHDETFLVTVTDEHGAYSQQLVTVTVTGTNDIPLITSTIDDATGDVLEAGVMDGGNDPEPGNLMTGGTLTADDVDNGASWSWSFVAQVNDYGTFDIDADTGVWSYTLADNALVNALAQGEMHDETFLVTVTDEHGAYSQQLVTVTVTGTNDIPVLTVDTSGGVTEDLDVVNQLISDTGALSFTDVDTGDTASVSSLYNSDITWSGGTLTDVLTQDQIDQLIAGFSADQDSWDFSISNELIQFLGETESITLSFNVTVTDNNGAYDTEVVTITIDGVNDVIEGEFAKEIWVPAAVGEITDPYLSGYPLLVTKPSDIDVNDTITITNLALVLLTPDLDPTVELGSVYYMIDGGNTLTLIDFDNPPELSATELETLVYVPGDNGEVDYQLDLSFTFTVNSGSDSIDGEFIIHSVPANSLAGQTVQIGDGSSPLTSGNDQDADLVISEQFANAMNSDPESGSLQLFTDYQRAPFDIPVPLGEQDENTAAGAARESEVSVRLTIGSAMFEVIAENDGDGIITWSFDADSGLMKAEIDYSAIFLLDGNGDPTATSLADYIMANPLAANDIWRITYLDDNGGNFQARFVEAVFTHDQIADDSITVVGTDNINNLIFGSTSSDSLTGANLDDRIFGREGNDILKGLAGNDELIGGAGNDDMEGGEGNDILIGGTGTDTIEGGIGRDYLSGGQGSDSLDGGALNGADDGERDFFVWEQDSADNSTDTVYNFNNDVDVLDLTGLLVGEENGNLEDFFSFDFTGGNTTIFIDADGLGIGTDGVTIVLDGIDLSLVYGSNAESDIIAGLIADEALIVDPNGTFIPPYEQIDQGNIIP
ncbi:retention module-containing protein [Shewanella sp. c952]|uniref:retention module-containing protein n=1 Tax=Shewanella sp. c952 TaxID=2815913 RepID=UPI001C7D31EF|nr:retention module-containing protein [Shewanella sp. c952]